MKLVKVVFVAAAMIVSGSAMAEVGEFRSTNEQLREGQLICPQIAESARKKAEYQGRSSEKEISRDVANSVSGQ